MKARRGFTLVELLVVIAIVAILAAVSMSSISAAFKSAQTTKCSSNLRQIGTAFGSYLTDHNNIMPQRYYVASGIGYNVLLAPYTDNNLTNKATSVFVCPSHAACTFPAEPSYGMNWYYDNTSIAMVTGLSTTIMAAETAGGDGHGSNRADKNSTDPGQLDPTRHSGWSNYLFFDGHVEKLQYASTTSLWGIDMGKHSVVAP